jgi:hypothetical protein
MNIGFFENRFRETQPLTVAPFFDFCRNYSGRDLSSYGIQQKTSAFPPILLDMKTDVFRVLRVSSQKFAVDKMQMKLYCGVEENPTNNEYLQRNQSIF